MPKTYTTIQGDLWDSIAYHQLGSVHYTDKLLKLNQQYREIYIFPAGIVLQLPEPEKTINHTLPPWKRREAEWTKI